MQHRFRTALFIVLVCALGLAPAHAGKIALLLEQPYGKLGQVDPLGHSAIYFTDVCAETPVRVRRCHPGERGVVISRYHRIDGYDWVAMPLLPYLYAVTSPDEIPNKANRSLVMRLRSEYRRGHLEQYVPDDPRREIPRGDWLQLLGESYDRRIYGFALETSPEQDDALIAMLNGSKNRKRYNLIFNNCANFVEEILNFYYPHSIHRNFIADAGIMTPKQAAHSLEKYAKRHSDLEFSTFLIPQVPGTIGRSTSIHGVLEGLLETKKYSVPLMILHPEIAGGMLAVYLGDGRFHPGAQIAGVFDPRKELEPGITVAMTAKPTADIENTDTSAETALQPVDVGPAD